MSDEQQMSDKQQMSDEPSDLIRGAKTLLPLLWHTGPIPAEDLDAILDNSKSKYPPSVIRHGIEHIKGYNSRGSKVFCVIDNPSEDEQKEILDIASRLSENLWKPHERREHNGIVYSLRNVITLIVTSPEPPMHSLMDYVWPCGTIIDYQQPTTSVAFKSAVFRPCMEGQLDSMQLKPIEERKVVNTSIAAALGPISMIQGRKARVLDQKAYDEAVTIWTDQRAKYNLYSGIEEPSSG